MRGESASVAYGVGIGANLPGGSKRGDEMSDGGGGAKKLNKQVNKEIGVNESIQCFCSPFVGHICLNHFRLSPFFLFALFRFVSGCFVFRLFYFMFVCVSVFSN